MKQKIDLSKKPLVSIICSAVRPKNWMSIYKSCYPTSLVDLEFVFVGPNTPDYALPDNFQFIHSNVKPSQCIEIASRNIRGDFIMIVADDCILQGEKPIDTLYKKFLTYKNDKIIVSCIYVMDGKIMQPETLLKNDLSAPKLPIAALMKSSIYRQLGGLDKNFIAVMADLDLYFRFYSIGGDVVFSNIHLSEDRIVASAGISLCIDYHDKDKNYLLSAWVKNGKHQSNRLKKFEPFEDKDIIKISQGPRGRWRGNRFLIFEKIIDTPRLFKNFFILIAQVKRYPEFLYRILLSFIKK